MADQHAGVEYRHPTLGGPDWELVAGGKNEAYWPPDLATTYDERQAHRRNSEQLMWADPAPWAEPGGGATDSTKGGLCSQTDPELFFPEKGENANAALKVCSRCLIQIECLEGALEREEEWGVWGGVYFGGRQGKTQEGKIAVRRKAKEKVAAAAGDMAVAA